MFSWGSQMYFPSIALQKWKKWKIKIDQSNNEKKENNS